MQLFEIFRSFTGQRYLHYIILLIYIILCSKIVLVAVGQCWSLLVALVCWSGYSFQIIVFFFFWKIDDKPLNMKNASVVSSPSGFQGYDNLPEGYRLATIDDFITKGKRNIGLKFLIQWVDNAFFYQICEVSMNLTSAILKPHLESKRVFVKDESHKLFNT